MNFTYFKTKRILIVLAQGITWLSSITFSYIENLAKVDENENKLGLKHDKTF